MSGFREVIGWHSALGGELAVLFDGEQRTVAPDIGAVTAHVKGQIAKELDAQFGGLSADRLPLPVEMPLDQPFPQQGVGVLFCPGPQCFAVMPGQGAGPVPPGRAVLIMQNTESGMVIEPGSLLLGPGAEGGVLFWILVRPGLEQRISQGIGPTLSKVEIHPLVLLQRCISAWSGPEGVQVNEPLIGQVLAIEEPGVQGIARGRAVGRSGGIRRGQGEHLPDADAMVGQQLEPTAAGFAKAAADGAARQGSGMQQHPGAAPLSRLGRVNSGWIHGGLFVSQGWLLQKSAASPRSWPAMPSRATRSKNCSRVSVP